MAAKSLLDIANQLVDYCRNDKAMDCLDALYDANAVSVEAMVAAGQDSAETKGIDGIKAKHDWWDSTMEVHSAQVDGPYLHGDNRFAVIFEVDATNKDTNERGQMKEVGVYTLARGKIIREEFFYTM